MSKPLEAVKVYATSDGKTHLTYKIALARQDYLDRVDRVTALLAEKEWPEPSVAAETISLIGPELIAALTIPSRRKPRQDKPKPAVALAAAA